MESGYGGRPVYIGVIGLGDEEDVAVGQAFEVGRLIGASGAVLICGGLGGVMNAAARGAKETRGTTIGVLPGETRHGESAYIDYSLPTGLGHGRNLVIVNVSDGLIAIGAGYGTLSEIALALKTGKPVVGLGTWSLCKEGRAEEAFPAVLQPREAVRKLFDLLKTTGRP